MERINCCLNDKIYPICPVSFYPDPFHFIFYPIHSISCPTRFVPFLIRSVSFYFLFDPSRSIFYPMRSIFFVECKSALMKKWVRYRISRFRFNSCPFGNGWTRMERINCRLFYPIRPSFYPIHSTFYVQYNSAFLNNKNNIYSVPFVINMCINKSRKNSRVLVLSQL